MGLVGLPMLPKRIANKYPSVSLPTNTHLIVPKEPNPLLFWVLKMQNKAVLVLFFDNEFSDPKGTKALSTGPWGRS